MTSSIEGYWKHDIIVRSNIAEEFWQKVIVFTKEYRVCALDTPEIGKTTSTGILIRLLLKKKHTVAYHVRTDRKEGCIYRFAPQDNLTGHVDVEVVPEQDFKITAPKFNNPSMYYVVNPGTTEDSCNPSTIYQG